MFPSPTLLTRLLGLTRPLGIIQPVHYTKCSGLFRTFLTPKIPYCSSSDISGKRVYHTTPYKGARQHKTVLDKAQVNQVLWYSSPGLINQPYQTKFGYIWEADFEMELKEDFIKQYENVVQPLLQCPNPGLQSVTSRLTELLSYNTKGGKMHRGCAVVHTTRLLGREDLIFKATVLGWCVEILQAFFLVADDIMDKSEKRRGKPCWYKKPGVGLVAINDSFLLESCVFELLKHHIGSEPYYLKCLELFLRVIRLTEIGQALDLESESVPAVEYTSERYEAIATHKTSYYSFYLPVALALHLCERDSDKELNKAETLLLKIGHYFQVQDDYLDCYGDPAVIGKVGTDIQEKKFSWLFLKALQSVSDENREMLISNYGKNDLDNVAAVKKIYEDLNLRQKFHDYSKVTYENICEEIGDDDSVLPPKIFQDFVDAIHRRSK